MTMIDEILPKVKAEVRLDKDNKTLWIKTDTFDGYGRVIIEDGTNWCRIFYEDCGECAHNEAEQTEPNCSEKPNNCKDEPQTERPTRCSECKVWHRCFKEKPSYNMIKSRCPLDEAQTERSE